MTDYKEHSMVEIAMICDDDYIIPTLTAIESLCASKNAESHYCIHIISEGISTYYKSIIRQFENQYVSIDFIDEKLGNLAEVNIYPESSYGVATPTALLKFRLPFLINSDKLLYLDGDIIVRSDLTQLFKVELDGYYAGVVVDSGTLYLSKKEMIANPQYFNSGVMLLNLAVLREQNVTDLLIKEKIENNQTGLMDQDAFNSVFLGHTKILDIKWNCLAINLIRASDKYRIDDLNRKYGTSIRTLNELIDNARIIHFASKDKPWKYYNIPLAKEWYTHFIKVCKKLGLQSSLIHREKSEFDYQKTSYSEKKEDIIVSITSYPARIGTVNKAIETMLTQTVKPDKILLWLSTENFPNKKSDLPAQLLNLEKRGLEIRWCSKDIGPHKKYFYSMKEFKNSVIITIDDDIYYPDDMIENLINAHNKYPGTVCCVCAHTIKMFEDYSFMPYNDWRYGECLTDKPSDVVFPIGYGGVLYPPNCFSEKLFDQKTIERTCLYADDLWLKWREIKEEIPCVLVTENMNLEFIDPDKTQKSALYKTNLENGGNDVSWKAILESDNYISIYGHDVRQKLYIQYASIDFEKNAYLRKLEREIDTIRNSYSYRIGCIATWLPRKLRRVIRACEKHGILRGIAYNASRLK